VTLLTVNDYDDDVAYDEAGNVWLLDTQPEPRAWWLAIVVDEEGAMVKHAPEEDKSLEPTEDKALTTGPPQQPDRTTVKPGPNRPQPAPKRPKR
jgi:hypothetical protein